MRGEMGSPTKRTRMWVLVIIALLQLACQFPCTVAFQCSWSSGGVAVDLSSLTVVSGQIDYTSAPDSDMYYYEFNVCGGLFNLHCFFASCFHKIFISGFFVSCLSISILLLRCLFNLHRLLFFAQAQAPPR